MQHTVQGLKIQLMLKHSIIIVMISLRMCTEPHYLNYLYCTSRDLKETVSRDFRPLVFFHQTIPSRPLIHILKYFRILLRIRLDINEYVLSRAMPSYDPALCGIALDQLIKLWSHAVRFKKNNLSKFVHR
jgi:hypothetical protein